jgi:hypothetical protein
VRDGVVAQRRPGGRDQLLGDRRLAGTWAADKAEQGAAPGAHRDGALDQVGVH